MNESEEFDAKKNTTEAAGEDAVPNQIKTQVGIQEHQNFNTGIPYSKWAGVKQQGNNVVQQCEVIVPEHLIVRERLIVMPLSLQEEPSTKGSHDGGGQRNNDGQRIRAGEANEQCKRARIEEHLIGQIEAPEGEHGHPQLPPLANGHHKEYKETPSKPPKENKIEGDDCCSIL
ncbi:hypothetical protein Nepgr_001483 [Nepenthes gracilis]|uniref:Uncharacterized protein n=1 Tax=Nepenthes gracilis TaxID=150966 RepID=A0AAD3RX22_NEPGR|nr:hypothetical protein Nepgr_001483 [Nepenthes gracilis]